MIYSDERCPYQTTILILTLLLLLLNLSGQRMESWWYWRRLADAPNAGGDGEDRFGIKGSGEDGGSLLGCNSSPG